MNQKEHLYSLDLLRGFSGYGVAFCHLHAFIYNNSHLEYFSLLFVEFFFILSGFVLYPQLMQVLNNKKNLLIFYKRRWIRTLPLYFIVLIMVASIFNDEFGSDFFKYFLFIQKTLPNFLANDYYPVAWSLSIEEFFYIIFPLIIIFIGKKDFQQLYLVKKFLRKKYDSKIIECKTIRDKNKLALSSRNLLLNKTNFVLK